MKRDKPITIVFCMYLLRKFVISYCNGKCDSEVTYTIEYNEVLEIEYNCFEQNYSCLLRVIVFTHKVKRPKEY